MRFVPFVFRADFRRGPQAAGGALPRPPAPRGFTLLEVLVALAIFALTAIVLGSAYLNILSSYEAVSRQSVVGEDIAFARQLVLAEPDRLKLEKGGEFETAGGRRAQWSVGSIEDEGMRYGLAISARRASTIATISLF